MKQYKLLVQQSFLIILAFLFRIDFGMAQDFHKDFTSLAEVYQKSGRVISFNVTIIYYPHQDSKQSSDSVKGRMSMQGSNFYYKLGEYEYLKNNVYYLMIDRESKLVMVERSTAAYSPSYDFHLIDSLINRHAATITSLPPKKNLRGYNVSFNVGSVNSLELWFDPKNFHIATIVLNYKDTPYFNEIHEPKVVISYWNYSVQEQNGPEAFSEKKFIAVRNEEIVPSASLKGYKVHQSFNP